jgi:hypothetical protein
MRNSGLALAVVITAAGWAGGAAAAPGLANRVYSPYVRKGVTELELRGGRLTGGEENGDSALKVELEHGFTDRLNVGLVAEFEDEPAAERKLDSVGLEAIAYVGQIPGIGVDVGGYLEYEQRLHNESGVVEGKILLARRFGPVQGLLNLIAEQPLTNREGEGAMEFGYAAQATVDAGHQVQVGVQAFGDAGTNRSFGGRQDHYVGPVVRWETRPRWAASEFELEAAYLFPVGPAADKTDGQVRLMFEWEKRF